MFSKIKEECGIFGIYAMENEEELAPTIGIGFLVYNIEEKKVVVLQLMMEDLLLVKRI